MSKIRPIGLAVTLCALVGCSIPLGDRVIQVRARVVSESGATLRNCELSLMSGETDKVIESKLDVDPQYLNSFVDPPAQGSYYFRISCPGREKSFSTRKHSFARGHTYMTSGQLPSAADDAT